MGALRILVVEVTIKPWSLAGALLQRAAEVWSLPPGTQLCGPFQGDQLTEVGLQRVVPLVALAWLIIGWVRA